MKTREGGLFAPCMQTHIARGTAVARTRRPACCDLLLMDHNVAGGDGLRVRLVDVIGSTGNVIVHERSVIIGDFDPKSVCASASWHITICGGEEKVERTRTIYRAATFVLRLRA